MDNQRNNYIKKIDHYYLKKEISKSEKSIVYLAVDNRNDKLMSVKAFKNKDLEKNNRKEKLQNEIEILLKLKNKNIIRLKNFKKTKNNSYLITEYCNGGNLKDFLLYYKNTKKIPLNELFIQKIIRQIAQGLEFIHSKNIIHRDLTLDNILLNFSKYQNIAIGGEIPPKVEYSELSFNDSFTLKIADLDYSKDVESSGPAKTVIGTAKNMAPDIAKYVYEDQPNKTYNNKIDLWSLGTITYELLTGQTPFSGKDSEDIYKKIIEGKYNLPSNLVVSVEIISFINGLLQFYPEKRMDWPQIKNHPFIKDNVDNFNFIELNSVKENVDKNEIEMNSKNSDNLLWILFKVKNGTTFDLDKLNINLDENQKKEMEKKINENKVNNDEIKIAVEDKKKNIEEDKERLKKEIKKAQELKKIAKKKISEVYNIQNEKRKNELRIKELEDKLKGSINSTEQEIKKEKDKLIEEVKIIDGFKKEDEEKLKENEKLLKIAEKVEFDAQKDLINIKLKEIFNPQELSLLKAEKDVIKFFKNYEKECEKYFFLQFGRNEFLRDFWKKKIEEIFKTDVHICELTKNIYSKLEQINKEEIEDEDEYNEKLFTLFPDMLLPDFLIAKDLKSLRCKAFPKKRNKLINNLFDKILMRSFTDESVNIVEFYENIKNNKIQVFNEMKNKNEIYKLLILINDNIFNKSYYGDPFSDFLKNNENLIKEYFGNNIKYNDILEKINNMNENEKNTEKDNLFKKIEEDINLDADKLNLLISSLYYILIYKFKDSKINEDKNNLKNIFINLILKNFVIFLDKKFIDIDKNLLDLLNLLYLIDICKSLENKKTNKYTFEEINSLLKDSDENLWEMFSEQKYLFWKIKVGPFTLIKKKIDENCKKAEDFRSYNNIILKPLEKIIYSNNITIIVDYFSEVEKNQIDEWRDFIGYFNKETIFYFFNWSCITKNDLLYKGNYKKMKENVDNINFSIKSSKICGKILAYILFSNKFFSDFNINLIGFGLGCNVVKHCIKEMHVIKQNNNFINLKNVILIGGATHLNKKKWEIYIEDLIADKFINCYSTNDEILNNFNEIGTKGVNKKAIGNEKLEIKNIKGIDLVKNYDFSEKNFDQLSYKLKFVVETIFETYKDI